MSRLYLLRHAVAAWPQPGMKDFDRPLEPTGLGDAKRLGGVMRARQLVPDRVLCSTAVRARQTWGELAKGLGTDPERATYLDELYHSDIGTYSDLITEAAGDGSLLVVGHNPMMEDVALAFSADGEPAAKRGLRAGFAACGLAIIDLDGPIHSAQPDKGYLRMFLRPQDLNAG
ncbi:histidine phosphatase family protein [Notoacmeibacter sp. MSK16QG-6]|uniref:SixA phosphatase family protein n=1 Tax=Notoacmeibacter sp. MSK16QG-6 TaxID=2957982 RepID=UPI00209E4D12|nr:histidine phosphatase family protein [Notoacmeibacter sp. MSK16QG-6]MCP1197903.1 histidine phosphatase family protein [Notoacmeibacter sp. MSK16QG-6]